MTYPIMHVVYTVNIPLTETEKKANKKMGRPLTPVTGKFRYIGKTACHGRTKFIFKESPYQEDGQFYTGRTLHLNPVDFEIGVDLRKIRGRVKTLRVAA